MTMRTQRQTTPNLAGHESFDCISTLTLVVEKDEDKGIPLENIGNLSKGVFERSTSTGIGLWHCWAVVLIMGQIVSSRVKTLNSSFLLASRHF